MTRHGIGCCTEFSEKQSKLHENGGKMSILMVKGLKKYYQQEPNLVRALDGIDLAVEEGEFVAVVGTSGSGKSTLLYMLGGLDYPTEGSVSVCERELSGSMKMS